MTSTPESDTHQALESMWNFLYWLNFVLCWIVFPIMSNYFDSSEFTARAKMCFAIKRNLLIYGIGAAGLVVFILYFVVKAQTLDFEDTFAFLMSLSSAFGLVQIIFFLSNGLIAAPRSLYRKCQPYRKLKVVCCQLVQVSEIIEDRRLAVDKSIRETQAVEILTTGENKRYIEKIYELVPIEMQELLVSSSLVDPSQVIDSPRNCGYSRIVQLHYDVKFNLYELSAYSR